MDVYGKCIFREKLQFVNLKVLVSLIFFCQAAAGWLMPRAGGSREQSPSPRLCPAAAAALLPRRGGGWGCGGGAGRAQASRWLQSTRTKQGARSGTAPAEEENPSFLLGSEGAGPLPLPPLSRQPHASGGVREVCRGFPVPCCGGAWAQPRAAASPPALLRVPSVPAGQALGERQGPGGDRRARRGL